MTRSLLFGLVLTPCLASAAAGDVPRYVLEIPASVRTILIADTESATLHRYAVDNGALILAEEPRISMGQNGVGKRATGDRRTPLGIYFIVDELETIGLHEKYGPLAFPLDYPNAWDRAKQRTGSGIWIHGVAPGSGPRPERDTDGCIALANADLLSLSEHLAPLRTPVIVARRVETLTQQEITALRDQLLAALELWKSSFRDGNWSQFLALYAEDFAYRGMTRDEWIALRLQSGDARTVDEFSLDDILLLADPEDADLYLSRFRQTIRESGRTIATTKRLYWRKSPQGSFMIVAEDNG